MPGYAVKFDNAPKLNAALFSFNASNLDRNSSGLPLIFTPAGAMDKYRMKFPIVIGYQDDEALMDQKSCPGPGKMTVGSEA